MSVNLPSNVQCVSLARHADGPAPRLRVSSASRTIVIDVGKSFMQSAVEWFPKYGLRRIDAVLITHGHADGTRSVVHSCASRSLNSDRP